MANPWNYEPADLYRKRRSESFLRDWRKASTGLVMRKMLRDEYGLNEFPESLPDSPLFDIEMPDMDPLQLEEVDEPEVQKRSALSAILDPKNRAARPAQGATPGQPPDFEYTAAEVLREQLGREPSLLEIRDYLDGSLRKAPSAAPGTPQTFEQSGSIIDEENRIMRGIRSGEIPMEEGQKQLEALRTQQEGAAASASPRNTLLPDEAVEGIRNNLGPFGPPAADIAAATVSLEGLAMAPIGGIGSVARRAFLGSLVGAETAGTAADIVGGENARNASLLPSPLRRIIEHTGPFEDLIAGLATPMGAGGIVGGAGAALGPGGRQAAARDAARGRRNPTVGDVETGVRRLLAGGEAGGGQFNDIPMTAGARRMAQSIEDEATQARIVEQAHRISKMDGFKEVNEAHLQEAVRYTVLDDATLLRELERLKQLGDTNAVQMAEAQLDRYRQVHDKDRIGADLEMQRRAGNPRIEGPIESDIPRTRMTVNGGDLTFRPDIFQARDVDVGGATGNKRVRELAENFDPAMFTPPSVVPDPDAPGRYIVYRGHHRTEAYRQIYGKDHPIEVIVAQADINDPAVRQQIMLEGDASNFKTAEANFRERVRAAQRAEAAGLDIDAIAGRLRKSANEVQGYLDAARLGPQALDRVTLEGGTLGPLAAELGRGMKVYGIRQADALAWFNRIASADKGARPTSTALKTTIDKYGKKLRDLPPALFDVDALGGSSRGGLLGMMDEHARLQGQLRTEMTRANNTAKRVRDLQKSPSARAGDVRAMDRTAKVAEREVARLKKEIAKTERDVLAAFRSAQAEARSGAREGMPLASSSSGDSSVPNITSRTESPPRTQVDPSQVSMREVEPSDSTRPTVPSKSTTFVTDSTVASKSILHDLNDVDQILAAVKEQQPAFERDLQSIAGDGFISTRLKAQPGDYESTGYQRILEKAAAKGKQPNELSDYLGGRLSADDPQPIIDRISEFYEIIGDEQKSLSTGYRARHLQVKLPGGVSAEVQIVPPRIAGIQDFAHAPYERLRSLGKDGAPYDDTLANQLERASRYMYENAPEMSAERAAAIQRAYHRGDHRPPEELAFVVEQGLRIAEGGEPVVARTTLFGDLDVTHATEAELGGYRPEQGQLGMGSGERPVETAGPLFDAQQGNPPTPPVEPPSASVASRNVEPTPSSRVPTGMLTDEQQIRLAEIDQRYLDELIPRRARGENVAELEEAYRKEVAEFEQGVEVELKRAMESLPDDMVPGFIDVDEAPVPQSARALRSDRETLPVLEADRPTLVLEEPPVEASSRPGGPPGSTGLDDFGTGAGGPPPPPPPAAAAGGGGRRRRGGEPNSDEYLGAIMDAPSNEKVWTTLWRRWEGERRVEGDQAIQTKRELEVAAKDAGIPLTGDRTPEMESLMAVLNYDAPISAIPEPWRPWANQVREWLKQDEMATIAVDPSFENRLRPEYFPHFFKKAHQGVSGFAKRMPLGQKAAFMRQRKLEGTLEEIFQKRPDLDLISWNPLDIVERRIAYGIEYRASQMQLQRMRALGVVKKRSDAPAEWITPDAPAFRSKPIKVNPGEKPIYSEPLAVPPEFAQVLNDQFGISSFSTNTGLRALRTVAATAKTIKVLGGLFQYFDYTTRALAVGVGHFKPKMVPAVARSWARGFIPAIDKRMLKYDLQDPTRRALLENGLQVDGGLDIMERSFRQTVQEEGWFGNVPYISDAVDYLTTGSYSRSHREFLLSVGEVLAEDNMRQGMPLQTAAAAAARSTNEYMSSLPAWQSVMRNRTTRDAVRTLGFFAPGEAEGWVRNFFRPLTGPNRAQAAKYWLGLFTTVGAMAEMANLAFTGKPLDKEAWMPFKLDPTSGKPQFNTRFMRPELPWKSPEGRKLYLDLLGQADSPMRWIADPLYSAKSRLGQIPTTIISVAPAIGGYGNIRGFFGKEYEGMSGALEFATTQIAPIPITGWMEEKGLIGGRGAAVQSAGFNVSAEQLSGVKNRAANEMFGRDYDDLTKAERAQVDDSPGVAKAAAGSRERGLQTNQAWAKAQQIQVNADKALEVLGELFTKGQITAKQYRDRRGDIFLTAAAQRGMLGLNDDRPPRNEEEKILQGWYDRIEQERVAAAAAAGLDPDDANNLQLVQIDPERFEEIEQAYRREIGPQGEAMLDAGLGVGKDPVDQEYRQVQKALEPYWQLADDAWRGFQEKVPELQAYKSIDAYKADLRQSLMDTGKTQVEASVLAERDVVVKQVARTVSQMHLIYRRQHPEADELLAKWYGATPLYMQAGSFKRRGSSSALQSLASGGGRRKSALELLTG